MDKNDCLYAFELPLESALKTLSHFEIKAEDGEWIYFNQNGNNVNALYKSKNSKMSTESIIQDVSEDFIDFFLGRFTPDLSKKVGISSQADFISFCKELNRLLQNGNKVFDLSRVDFWIWSDATEASELSPGLKSFLDI